MDFVWNSFILIIAGIVFMRIAGRKSISQMTLAQTVVMLSIGTIIVEPIVEASLLKTLAGVGIFIFSVVILEIIQMKSNFLERLITGKSKVVIRDGKIDVEALKKLRLSVDQLEMRLRNQGISSIEDLKMATLEANGIVGYELKDDQKPLTVGEFKKAMDAYFPGMQPVVQNLQNKEEKQTIFGELDGQQRDDPNFLQ
ncbi:DUF421 domain-containing protein [Neobacillus notoginsengisoli]|uniref:DUF421 domain-containing protein n=1 Tax=Neobacillus notoginsengisoli TaxID=1578198 RepID=A0A417YS56_9BACI|nr:DUF421 domain-containing protein [Neobacillus notoginsengisoli]RHW38122.1 DUF421 domain-containing protein [Neobacillus notoginsengisoli]